MADGLPKQRKLQGEAIPGPEDLGDEVIVSPDTRRAERLPPRQARTKKWPVLDAHGPPRPEQTDAAHWKLVVTGMVREELELDRTSFEKLPRVQVFADMHCVTRWSRLGNVWEGVSGKEILSLSRPRPEARFVLLHGLDWGFTTNLPLEAFSQDDVLLADRHDGAPISLEHGGPVRAVVPRLYAWKSAKWLCRIELVAEDQPGYWERLGYHMVGDPWTEQRYRSD